MCYHLHEREEKNKKYTFYIYFPHIFIEYLQKNNKQKVVASRKGKWMTRRMEWRLFNVSYWTF